jgi:hypothetical protein
VIVLRSKTASAGLVSVRNIATNREVTAFISPQSVVSDLCQSDIPRHGLVSHMTMLLRGPHAAPRYTARHAMSASVSASELDRPDTVEKTARSLGAAAAAAAVPSAHSVDVQIMSSTYALTGGGMGKALTDLC